MQRLTLFAKCPRPGRVKTRLVPPLTAAQAAELHEAFVADQLRLMATFAPRYLIELCSDAPWPGAIGIDGLRLSVQGDGDLGRRLERHFEQGVREGIDSTLVLGADAPTLPAAVVRSGLERLAAGAPAVVSPADDGGYTALGMAAPLPELLREVPWGGPRVYAVTSHRADEAGIELAVLDPWFDVDDAAGLRRLAAELALPRGLQRAPASAEVLRRLDSGNKPVI